MDLRYNNFTEAWESLNELFIEGPKPLFSGPNGTRFARAQYLYNVSVDIENPILDPEFDFGRKFNYTQQKWTMLMSNYICMDKLAILKQEITTASQSRKPFNITYDFHNTHKNGKGCLIAMLATKRYANNTPYLTFYLRASEITKRLSVDFLLAQRIGEYLFNGQNFKVTFNFNQLFNDDTVLLMYHAHKNIRGLLRKSNNENAPILLKRLKEMLHGEEKDFKKYKVHFRAFKVIRPDLYKYPQLLAKNCKLPS